VALLSEFSIIETYFARSALLPPDISLAQGDDCALVLPPADQQLCLSIDTQVAGRHFLETAPASAIATRALGSALSDLAAMGAKPSHFTLALTLPGADEKWLAEFSKSLSDFASKHGVVLIGGDTTRGPLTITIQVHGWVELDKALKRSGAKEGDLLVVSGSLGDAAGGLSLIKASKYYSEYLEDRFYRPQPRLALGQQLIGRATSCIDVSDGLVADAAHLSRASGLDIAIELSAVPISSELLGRFPDQAQAFALAGGDDYELLFSIDTKSFEALQSESDMPLTVIGHFGKPQEKDKPRVMLTENDCEVRLPREKGYLHFG
jgi:thiamine-monophosphate kinase